MNNFPKTPQIAIIENEDDLRKIQTKYLGPLGNCSEFISGEDFLVAAASGYKPDLIVCDLRLQNMDGLEVFERVRSEGLKAKLLLVTGYANPTVRTKAESLGVHEIIEKPFTSSSLFEKVSKILKSA